MSRPALALLPLLLASSSAASGFTPKSFGDGGGYKHPDRETSEYLERAVPKPERSDAPPSTAPETVRVVAERPDAPPRAGAPSRAISPRPGELARNAPASGAADEGADGASDAAREDYERKILGEAPAARRPGLAGGPALARAEDAATAGAPPAEPETDGKLFVSLELDPAEAGTLRDAVAGLGAAASFRPDARFQPEALGGGLYKVSGWIPAARLNDAVSRPGVRRVAVSTPGRSQPRSPEGEYLIGVRVADPARADETARAAAEALSRRSGFRLRRVIGVETLPGGAALAVLEGALPVLGVSRALETPGVLSVEPAPRVLLQAASGASAARRAPANGGFVSFMLSRGLWLVILTVLLVLPTAGRSLRRALTVFVPYR